MNQEDSEQNEVDGIKKGPDMSRLLERVESVFCFYVIFLCINVCHFNKH